jgi:hypothetical protein
MTEKKRAGRLLPRSSSRRVIVCCSERDCCRTEAGTATSVCSDASTSAVATNLKCWRAASSKERVSETSAASAAQQAVQDTRLAGAGGLESDAFVNEVFANELLNGDARRGTAWDRAEEQTSMVCLGRRHRVGSTFQRRSGATSQMWW